MMIVVIAATNLSFENRIMNARTMNRIELVYRIARFGFLIALGLLALSAFSQPEPRLKMTTRIGTKSRPKQDH